MLLEQLYLDSPSGTCGVINEGLGQFLLEIAKALGKAVMKGVRSLLKESAVLSASYQSYNGDIGQAYSTLSRDIDNDIRALPRNDPARKKLEACKRRFEEDERTINQLKKLGKPVIDEIMADVQRRELSVPIKDPRDKVAIYQRAAQASSAAVLKVRGDIGQAECSPQIIAEVSKITAINPQAAEYLKKDYDKRVAGGMGPAMAQAFSTFFTYQRFVKNADQKPEVDMWADADRYVADRDQKNRQAA